MIDNSPPGSWTRDKGLDLKAMSARQLSNPALIEAIREWHDLKTAAQARDIIAIECKRRTRETG